MLIRNAIETDLVDITNLMAELGYETNISEMKNRLSKLTNNPDYHTIVTELDNEVVGMLGLHIGLAYEFSGCYGRIVCLVVNKQYRKNGIGKKLIDRAKEIISERNGNTLVLNSGNRKNREDAHKFYLDNGFSAKSTGFVMKFS
ncbi:GNAT family N-acetyltransferase [Sporosarcina jiandibaonis]|uniref:GNAT family N-acetyltransferase n=1 Tax=Sporosarcina jiandibaonis TaxID=2715535 RepID=UPI0015566031|nr:GNAT family N-acetyltransferase [Sporosarcina jiandibaonis]